MGISKSSLLQINGKVSNLVHYTLGNKQVVRIVGEIKKPASLKQLACRQQLKVVVSFLNPIVGFVNAGFLSVARKADKQPHNMAVSYNKKHALQGVYPDVAIDYAKVLVAQGGLRKAENAQVVQVAEGLKFTWDTSYLTLKEKTQRVMLMAYFPDLKMAVYKIQGEQRTAGEDLLPLNDVFVGKYLETYISFISTPDNDVADSVYTGSLNAPD